MSPNQIMQRILVVSLFFIPISLSPANSHSKDASTYGYNQSKKSNPQVQKKKLSKSEIEALMLLCEMGLNVKGYNAWSNDDINAAISSISWGKTWPEKAEITAYKTCNFPSYGGRPRYPYF